MCKFSWLDLFNELCVRVCSLFFFLTVVFDWPRPWMWFWGGGLFWSFKEKKSAAVNFPNLSGYFLLHHHVRCGVHSGQEAGPGSRLRYQRQRGSVPESELRGSACRVSVCEETVLRPGLPRRPRGPGLQGAGPEFIQSPWSYLEETRGKSNRVWVRLWVWAGARGVWWCFLGVGRLVQYPQWCSKTA